MIENKGLYVSAAERDAFESLKIGANADDTMYYVGSNFDADTVPIPLQEGQSVDVSFYTLIVLDGEEPTIILQGKKHSRGLQSALTPTQMAAVNSGITATKRTQYDGYANGKQNTLNNSQMAAVNSGITAEKVEGYDGYGNDISALMAETFPLVVAYITNDATKTNNGTKEYGTTITPKVSWTAKRQGSNVASLVTLGTGVNWGTLAQDNLSYVGTEQALTSELDFSAQVSQGGQTKNLSQIKWTPSYYRYTIDLGTTKPATDADILSVIANAANSQVVTQYALSTVSTLGDTTLQAGHYYLFAVKGNVTLEAYDTALGGKVECDKGTLQVPLRNGYKESGSNDVKTFLYSYIIVDKGGTTWKFNIQNT